MTSQPAAVAFPAATVMAFRASPAGAGTPEVFLVRRHIRMGFFGGAYVFPGGRLDPADRDPDVGAWCSGADEARRGMADLDALEATAYRLAAIREMFEETGILLARDARGRWAYTSPEGEGGLDRSRQAVHSGALLLREVLQLRGLCPALEALIPIAHWVTPEVEPKRFDTRFFLASVEGASGALHDETEHVESAWMTAVDALARFDRREIVLAPPTWRLLKDFESCASWADVERHTRALVIRRVQPRFVQEDGEDLLVLPGDPLYPAPPDERLTPPTRFRCEPDRWQPVSLLDP
jgi:8-oxo-dGTP pyrophosphatase MutT (NUDIX family)